MGSCKMPWCQQYSNYSTAIISEADLIHCYMKDFLLQWSNKSTINVTDDHSILFDSLSHIKGVGSLSFNQFWHLLCLCGVLPVHFIHTTGITLASGPAKLIQTYYSECKSAKSIKQKVHQIKSNINKMGALLVYLIFSLRTWCVNSQDLEIKASWPQQKWLQRIRKLPLPVHMP